MNNKRKIFNNIVFLGVAELSRSLLLFFYIKHITFILGLDNYGIIAWTQSAIAYFVLFGNLGLEIYGTREIAKNPANSKNLVNNILTIKIVASLILYLLLLIFVYFIDKNMTEKIVVIIAGGLIFANAILINWVYQGLEKNHLVAIRQVLISIINLAGVYIFLTQKDQVIIAMSIIVSSNLINSIWLLFYYLKKEGKITFTYDKERWLGYLRQSFPIGITFFMIVIYNSTDIFMLGLIKENADVSLYDTASKLIIFGILPTQILQQAFFPQMSKNGISERGIKLANKYTLFTYLIAVLSCVIIFFNAEFIVLLQYNPEFIEAATLLKYFTIKLFIVYIAVSYSSPLMAWGKQKELMYSTIFGAIINVLLNFLLIPDYGIYGAMIATIISETIVLLNYIYHLRKISSTLFLNNILRALIVGIVIASIAYLMKLYEFYELFNIFATIIVFIFLIFITKTVKINEIKGIFIKNEN